VQFPNALCLFDPNDGHDGLLLGLQSGLVGPALENQSQAAQQIKIGQFAKDNYSSEGHE
jgi:hypothetical protein